jgi:Protein of unknown function (DUF3754)
MTEYQIRNRFIPFRKADIIKMCINDSRLSKHDQNLFRRFCHILGSLIHFEFHHQVEMFKDCYSPFNPDADTRLNYDYSEQEKKEQQKKFVETLTAILNAANFQKITKTNLEEALKEESLFQNVPKADLEMLFPNSEVRMKTVDKLIIGVPAAVSGIILTASKLGGTILLIAAAISFWLGLTQKEVKIEQQHLIALALGLATLGGFLFKQINKFKNRKIKFMKALSDNLYFKNLDNNTGVFHHLVDTAEEEEFKEAILAYYFLLVEDRDLTITQLDETVERWFENKHNCMINFEIEDALQKLERWNLENRDRNIIGRKSMNDAMQQLDKIWDNYFPYHKADELPKMS